MDAEPCTGLGPHARADRPSGASDASLPSAAPVPLTGHSPAPHWGREPTRALLPDRTRPGALLEAVTAISSDLDLRSVLIRLVESASGLTRARYAALGVVGDGG